MYGPDADVSKVVRIYNGGGAYANWNRTRLTLENVTWYCVSSQPHQGLTRRVNLRNYTGSTGTFSITVSDAMFSCRVHINAGLFVGGGKKMVTLPLLPEVLEGNIKINASQDKLDVFRQFEPITGNWDLRNRTVEVRSQMQISEGQFECTACLGGTVIMDHGQVDICEMTENIPVLPAPFSTNMDGSLCWPLKGCVEFILDRKDMIKTE